jgi:hypothetical protein
VKPPLSATATTTSICHRSMVRSRSRSAPSGARATDGIRSSMHRMRAGRRTGRQARPSGYPVTCVGRTDAGRDCYSGAGQGCGARVFGQGPLLPFARSGSPRRSAGHWRRRHPIQRSGRRILHLVRGPWDRRDLGDVPVSHRDAAQCAPPSSARHRSRTSCHAESHFAALKVERWYERAELRSASERHQPSKPYRVGPVHTSGTTDHPAHSGRPHGAWDHLPQRITYEKFWTLANKIAIT